MKKDQFVIVFVNEFTRTQYLLSSDKSSACLSSAKPQSPTQSHNISTNQQAMDKFSVKPPELSTSPRWFPV